MPVFHTKTIESILDPVAQQVSRLVIIHEEGEAGHEMPDLERPVLAVSRAVANLAKVGREMVTTTEDGILRQDMPAAITKVENAASLLEDASNISKADPYSKAARTKLIEGSRWILQGTSSVLLCFDESEVRKIIRECKKVLDYLSVAEVIDSMEDLVQFVKDLSPCLSKVTREVEKRVEDLTHQVHRESLSKCVDQIKTLAPILICSMKIFIQILTQGGKGSEEAAENRNYLAARMTEEVGEIVRVLQLVTYDEEEWSSDNIQVMKKTLGSIDGKMQGALDWLRDPTAQQGGVGERSLRAIVEQAEKVAERSLPLDAEHLRRLAGDVTAMTDALCELRAGGRGVTPQAENLARNIQSRLAEVVASVSQAVSRLEKSGIQQPAPTVAGRLEQARRWLEQPGLDDRGVGPQALGLILEEAKKVAEGLPAGQRAEILGLCSRVEAEQARLLEAVRRGEADTPQAMALARSLNSNIGAVVDCIQGALVDRVVEDFIDIATPLKQFTDCVLSPGDPATREQVFDVKSAALVSFSGRVVSTARLVATGNTTGNKKLAEALLATTGQVESLTPQLVNAGRIRMVYPENKAADEHFENLRRQYAETVGLTRQLADEATDSARFVGQSAAAMQQHTARCDEAIGTRQPGRMVESTSSIARLANRVLQVTKNEAENSEDPRYIATLNVAADQLQTRVSPMVQFAKSVALNIDDQAAVSGWRRQNQSLLEAVQGVHRAVAHHSGGSQPPVPPYPALDSLSLQDAPAMAAVSRAGPAPSTDPPCRVFTDDELSEIFQIDFGQIFGNPEAGLKSSYKGIQGKKPASSSSSRAAPAMCPLPPPEQFQSSPAAGRRQLGQSQSCSAVAVANDGQRSLVQSHSSSALARQATASSVQQSQSFSCQQSYSSQQSSHFQTSNVTTSHKQVVETAPPPKAAISEPPAKIATSTAAEADVLIEELMEEAKHDPSFGVLTRLSSRPPSPPAEDPERQERGPPGGGVQVLPSVHQDRADSRGPYPFIPRPFRSGADMIIRDRSEEPLDASSRMSRTPDRHVMPSRPFRTATDFKIDDTSTKAAYKRSQSADSRYGKSFGATDPKISNFQRTSSTDNFTGEMMREVVTDKENRSVKDLVAQLETSTKSQSDNPYIRKWGCDMISHEPRKKNTTLRWERKDMPDPEFASRLQNQYSEYGSRTSSRARNLSEGSLSRDGSPRRDGFQMADYTADLDDLITDREHTEQDISLAAQEVVEVEAGSPSKAVVWPPASPLPGSRAVMLASEDMTDATTSGRALVTNNTVMTGSQMAMSSSVMQMSSCEMSGTSVTERKYQVTEPVASSPPGTARDFIVSEAENLVKKRKTKKLMKKDKVEEMNLKNSLRSAANSSNVNRSGSKFARDSLIELDNQIMDIQTGFEAELESLIDIYKGIQKRKSEGFQAVERPAVGLSTIKSNNSSIRETAELLCQELSDEEDGDAPPRPPPPSGGGQYGSLAPPRPPPPDTDDEADNMFEHAPTPSQGPIMMAAHELHQEVRQWSSKDNDIIAAAKKMALLMAKLSQLVQEDSGSKRELIAIAKAIAESSDEVTRLAKELAKECTDKRMRTNLLQVCERIPTIGTQLKILSTVKATMLGAQGTDEDIEATEMLVGNAQNLMQSVKQTVTAAEAASIKIRTEAGIRLKWVRKQPWYHY